METLKEKKTLQGKPIPTYHEILSVFSSRERRVETTRYLFCSASKSLTLLTFFMKLFSRKGIEIIAGTGP